MKTKNGYKGWIYRHHIINDKNISKSYVGRCVNKPNIRWQDGEGYRSGTFRKAIGKYGWNNFQHEILLTITCDTKEELNYWLNEWEKYYIWKYDSYYNGYNDTLGGDGSIGRKCSEETKVKISKARKGKKRKPESIEKMRKTITGRKHTEETKRKMSSAAKGKKKSKETIDKMKRTKRGNYSPEKGKAHGDKIRGKPNSRSKLIINLETGLIFQTSTQAAKWSGCHAENIRACCKHKNNSSKGLHWLYYEEYRKGLLLECHT